MAGHSKAWYKEAQQGGHAQAMPSGQKFTLLEQLLYSVWLETIDGADTTRDGYALLHAQPTLLNPKACSYIALEHVAVQC